MRVLSFKINRSWLKETFKKVYKHNAAGPESLEDYFQNGSPLGLKAALNLWYVDTKPNSQKLIQNI